MKHNKRQYFRHNFHIPLCADMTIFKIKDNQIDTNSTKICILDIGPGGLRFLTNLKLPVNPYVVLEFQTRILDHTLNFHGYIVRKVEGREEFHEYGVKFVLEEQEQMQLTSLLNSLSIRLRRNSRTSSCSFCDKEDNKSCLGKMDEQPSSPRQIASI
jgi:hypothetical protein